MLANRPNNESHLSAGDLGCIAVDSLSIPLQGTQEAEFRLPPAMPGSVLLLQLLLSSNVADLHAIAEIIRNDVGLTVQLLRLAALGPGKRSQNALNIGDLVVELGLEKLRELAAETSLIPVHLQQDAAPHPCEQFWMHARLSARISEGLAGQTTVATREAAYVAGLLRRLGALPTLLGWHIPEWDLSDQGEVGYRMAKAWRLPGVLADVIRGDDRVCTSQRSYSLLRLVNVADARAARWESVENVDRSPVHSYS